MVDNFEPDPIEAKLDEFIDTLEECANVNEEVKVLSRNRDYTRYAMLCIDTDCMSRDTIKSAIEKCKSFHLLNEEELDDFAVVIFDYNS